MAFIGGHRQHTRLAFLRNQVSDICLDINKDADFQKRMAEGGFELVDIGVDKMPAFMLERSKAYTEAARRMGLVK